MDQRLSELIEDLTTSGEPQLNPAKMKELKKICKYVRFGVPRGLAAQRARAPPVGFPWAPGMSHRPTSQAPTGVSAGKEPQTGRPAAAPGPAALGAVVPVGVREHGGTGAESGLPCG